MAREETYFEEKQRFNQWWLWLLLLAVNGLMIYGLHYQLIEGRPWGDRPASDAMLIGITVMLLLLTVFIRMLRLETRITSEGVYARFFPLHGRARYFNWHTIQRAYVRTYSPIGEYGGWGWRFSLGKGGKAYNVSGNMGLQLEFTNGKKLLIGTRRPQELELALSKMSKRRQV
jgi:hypothetical protein